MSKKPPHYIIRYLIEGALIFGSVYGAFLLEDYRSKSEQKKIFINRWNGLLNSRSTDSLKFTNMLHGIDGGGFLADQDDYKWVNEDVDVNEWVNEDSLVLANYDHLIQNGDLDRLIEVLKSFRYWAMSTTEEAPFYQDIIENHPDHYLELCQVNAQLCEWLDLYSQYHQRIDRYNRFTRETHIEFWGKIADSYPIPGVANSSDSIAIVKDFRSRSYLFDRHRHNKAFTLPTIELMV